MKDVFQGSQSVEVPEVSVLTHQPRLPAQTLAGLSWPRHLDGQKRQRRPGSVLAGTAIYFNIAQHKVTPLLVLQRVDADELGTLVDILPQVEGASVLERFGSHDIARRIGESDYKWIQE